MNQPAAHQSSTEGRPDGSVWITLDRGDRNMLDADLTTWLLDQLRRADADAPPAIVLTGAGTTFCGGADGPYLRESKTAAVFAEAAVQLFELLHTMGTPLVAALNGDALAGGFGLVCLADIVVAVDGAKLGTIEASLGSWPMIAQTPVLTRVPPKAAIANLLTGIPFDSRRGRELGVVDQVVAPDQLEPAVAQVVGQLTPGAKAARLGRPMARRQLAPHFSADLRHGAAAFVEMFG